MKWFERAPENKSALEKGLPFRHVPPRPAEPDP